MSCDKTGLLAEFLRRNRQFYRFLTAAPPRAKFGPSWQRIQEVRNLGHCLELVGPHGQRLRLPDDLLGRLAVEHEAAFLKRVVAGVLPGRRLRLRDPTAAKRRPRFLRLLARESSGEQTAVLAAVRGAAAQPSHLLCRLVLWWASLTQTRQAVILLPESWGDYITELLSRVSFPISCFLYSNLGTARKIYPRDRIGTETRNPYVIFPLQEEAPPSLNSIISRNPDLDLSYRADHWEISLFGFPVLWTRPDGTLGFDRFQERTARSENRAEWERHLEEVRRFRVFPPPDPSHPYYRFSSERWMESLVVHNLRLIEPDFADTYYCQVPTYVEGDRKVLDLLTATRAGRLAVLELKPEKDRGLVFQGLEYWERVHRHLLRGDLQRAGLFPDFRLLPEPPLLFLISPLFEFHRVMPIVRSYLRDEVHFECIGINGNWKKGLRILRRFRV